MSMYNLKFLKQEQCYKNGKFETLETKDMGNNNTWENIKNATSKETLKFFRKALHSKQVIKTEVKNGLTIVKIYSYEPYRTDKRTVHVYTEVKKQL